MNHREPNSTLTDEAVRHVATLARLALTDDEVTKAKEELTSIFQHISNLKTVSTDGVEPLDHPTEIINHFREDQVSEALTQQQVFANAPAIKEVYFDVPKVLGNTQ